MAKATSIFWCIRPISFEFVAKIQICKSCRKEKQKSLYIFCVHDFFYPGGRSQSQPVGSDHYFHTDCPSVPMLRNQEKINAAGLVEWIIDDFCHVIYYFCSLFYNLRICIKCPRNTFFHQGCLSSAVLINMLVASSFYWRWHSYYCPLIFERLSLAYLTSQRQVSVVIKAPEMLWHLRSSYCACPKLLLHVWEFLK